jgi:hypothetical protein
MQSRRVASSALGSWHVVLALSDVFILRVAANGEWVLLGEGGAVKFGEGDPVQALSTSRAGLVSRYVLRITARPRGSGAGVKYDQQVGNVRF